MAAEPSQRPEEWMTKLLVSPAALTKRERYSSDLPPLPDPPFDLVPPALQIPCRIITNFHPSVDGTIVPFWAKFLFLFFDEVDTNQQYVKGFFFLEKLKNVAHHQTLYKNHLWAPITT
jgi:hypothetical protein